MTASKARFRIIPFTNPSGENVFRVTGCKADGKQVRLNFPTIEAATLHQQELERGFLGLPQPSMCHVETKLTPAQVGEAEAAFTKLNGKSLLAATDFYLTHYREPVESKPLADAFSDFMKDKKAANRRPDTLRNLSDRVGRLCKAHPAKLVSEIMLSDVEAFIDKAGKGNYAKISDRSVLSGFFRWCVKRRFCQTNPAEYVTSVKVDQGVPVALSVPDARRVVHAALGYKDGVCLPYVALGLFCAIRPAELARITWDNIDLKRREITIEGGAAKKRKRRVVEISKNAAELLAPFALNKTPIVGKNWRRDFDSVRARAGFAGRSNGKNAKPWGADIMRHTGITFHFNLHRDENRTAVWAGNSGDVIHTSYRANVARQDVLAFWKIGATSKGNVLSLKAA